MFNQRFIDTKRYFNKQKQTYFFSVIESNLFKRWKKKKNRPRSLLYGSILSCVLIGQYRNRCVQSELVTSLYDCFSFRFWNLERRKKLLVTTVGKKLSPKFYALMIKKIVITLLLYREFSGVTKIYIVYTFSAFSEQHLLNL